MNNNILNYEDIYIYEIYTYLIILNKDKQLYNYKKNDELEESLNKFFKTIHKSKRNIRTLLTKCKWIDKEGLNIIDDDLLKIINNFKIQEFYDYFQIFFLDNYLDIVRKSLPNNILSHTEFSKIINSLYCPNLKLKLWGDSRTISSMKCILLSYNIIMKHKKWIIKVADNSKINYEKLMCIYDDVRYDFDNKFIYNSFLKQLLNNKSLIKFKNLDTDKHPMTHKLIDYYKFNIPQYSSKYENVKLKLDLDKLSNAIILLLSTNLTTIILDKLMFDKNNNSMYINALRYKFHLPKFNSVLKLLKNRISSNLSYSKIDSILQSSIMNFQSTEELGIFKNKLINKYNDIVFTNVIKNTHLINKKNFSKVIMPQKRTLETEEKIQASINKSGKYAEKYTYDKIVKYLRSCDRAFFIMFGLNINEKYNVEPTYEINTNAGYDLRIFNENKDIKIEVKSIVSNKKIQFFMSLNEINVMNENLSHYFFAFFINDNEILYKLANEIWSKLEQKIKSYQLTLYKS